VKLLAVTSLERWPDLPQVPTLHESGLPGFETIAWNGLFGPPGLPQPIVQRLVPELQRIGRLPEVQDRVKLIGGQVGLQHARGASAARAQRHRQVARPRAAREHPAQ
jgi:tripartite-type tricarboxylate transporter receptor subunit TctC